MPHHHREPAEGFRPDVGRITAYRSPGGAGVPARRWHQPGCRVAGHFDSMLVKLTCRGREFPIAVRRARRAVAEFRIRGVATNIPFLQAVLDDPDFRAGNITTSFIDDRPWLQMSRARPTGAARSCRTWPTSPSTSRTASGPPRCIHATSCPPSTSTYWPRRPDGSRQRLLARLGPEGLPPTCATAGFAALPTPRSATRTNRCWPPGSGPAA